MSGRQRPFGWPRIHIPAVESTMSVLSALARSGAINGTVLTTDFQSMGTGRDNRPWVAPSGSALLMSLIFRTRRPLNDIPVVSLLIGGCLAGMLDGFGIQAEIKWPNDVLVHGQKISGILVRSQAAPVPGYVDLIIGIGLNLTLASTVERPAATNIEQELGRLVDRRQVLDNLMLQIGFLHADFEAGIIGLRLNAVRSRLAMLDESVSIVSGSDSFHGRLTGLREDGALILHPDGGIPVYIVSGELQRGPSYSTSIE